MSRPKARMGTQTTDGQSQRTPRAARRSSRQGPRSGLGLIATATWAALPGWRLRSWSSARTGGSFMSEILHFHDILLLCHQAPWQPC